MLVRPKTEYAAVMWDPHTKDNIAKLEKIQRRAARVVMQDYKQTSSVTKMLKTLDWPSLELRRKASRLTTLFKINTGKVNVSIKPQPAPSRPRRAHGQTVPKRNMQKRCEKLLIPPAYHQGLECSASRHRLSTFRGCLPPARPATRWLTPHTTLIPPFFFSFFFPQPSLL